MTVDLGWHRVIRLAKIGRDHEMLEADRAHDLHAVGYRHRAPDVDGSAGTREWVSQVHSRIAPSPARV